MFCGRKTTTKRPLWGLITVLVDRSSDEHESVYPHGFFAGTFTRPI